MRSSASTRLPSVPARGARMSNPSVGGPHHGAALADEIRAVVAAGGGLIRAGTDALLSHVPRVTSQHASVPVVHGASQPGEAEQLAVLVYELLDAHADTARIAGEIGNDLVWRAHLEYLQALQRKGREMLARLP